MTLSYDMAGYYDIVLPPLLDIFFYSEMLKRPSRTDGETSNHSSWKVGVLESMREHMICCRAAAAPHPSRAQSSLLSPTARLDYSNFIASSCVELI